MRYSTLNPSTKIFKESVEILAIIYQFDTQWRGGYDLELNNGFALLLAVFYIALTRGVLSRTKS